jgi:hypothetical protein
VDTWQPNKLVDDEQNVAYEPKDKEGKQLARSLTLYLNLLMWRVKMDKTIPVFTQQYGRVTRPNAP